MSAASTIKIHRYTGHVWAGEPQAPADESESQLGMDSPASATWPKATVAFQPELTTVRLVVDEEDEVDTSVIEREFPTIALERSESKGGAIVTIDDFAWRGSFETTSFDEAIERARPIGMIAVRGTDAAGVAREVLARYQRLVMRRNDASSSPAFDSVLDACSMLFGGEGGRFKAEHDHALDSWQWMLRLDPSAGLAPQLAALLHDIDRLESEPHERIEHRVYRALDDAQAKRGGERALAVLRGIGIDEDTATRVRDLVAGRCPTEPDACLLDDADSLSFLSLGSARYADHFGLAQTRRKVTFVLGRFGPVAREKVSLLRLRPDVDRLLRSS